ncbi:uncharacterized protein LOC144446274 [Glandiceps talaboti]
MIMTSQPTPRLGPLKDTPLFARPSSTKSRQGRGFLGSHQLAPKSAPPRSSQSKTVAFTLPDGVTTQPVKERPQSVGTIRMNSDGLPVLIESPHAKARAFRRPYRSPSAPEINYSTQTAGNTMSRKKGSFPVFTRPQTSDGTSDYLKQRARKEFEEATARANDFCKRAHDEEFFYQATDVPEDVEFITARVASGKVILDTTPFGVTNARQEADFAKEQLLDSLPRTYQIDESVSNYSPVPPANGPNQRIRRRHSHSRSSNSSTTSRSRDVNFEAEIVLEDQSKTRVKDSTEHRVEQNLNGQSERKMQDIKCRVNQWLENVEQFQGISDDDQSNCTEIRTTELF